MMHAAQFYYVPHIPLGGATVLNITDGPEMGLTDDRSVDDSDTIIIILALRLELVIA